MIRTIEDFKILPDNVSKQWAKEELEDFLGWIKPIELNDEEIYSKDFDHIFKCWYYYIHEKLNEYGFVNGQPEENTWEKRPKAVFWWCIYCTFIPGHHLTCKEVQKEMINAINKAINLLK